MKNGLRHIKDGTSIFGIKNTKIKNSDTPQYDCFLNIKNPEEKGKIFKIYFDKNKKNYILYFLHNALILYYKINDYIYFDTDKDYYFILGNVFLTINIKEISSYNKQINIQIETENEKEKEYSFKQSEMPIKIGRINCNINISNNSISKIHCFINYSNNKFYYKDSNSTNGTSLLIREDDYLPIKGEMFFKLDNASFKIKEIPDEDES